MATMAVEAKYIDPSNVQTTKVFEGKGTTKKGVIEFLRSTGCVVKPMDVRIVTKVCYN